MQFRNKWLALSLCAFTCFANTPAFALDQIIRPYWSIRSSGMGGVRMTTGIFDENFFNNPARVTANPYSKFTLIQLTGETTGTTISNVSKLTGSGDALARVAGITGDNSFGRVQLILPAYYLTSNEDRKWAIALGLITNIQANGLIRKSYNMNFGALVDTGPALTFGYKFLKDDALSVGATAHVMYRVSTNPNYSLLNYVQGTSLTLSSLGGQGGMYDFDLGATYTFAELLDFKIRAGGAIQNILGGKYDKFQFKMGSVTNYPISQPRSYGLGVAAERKQLVFLTDTVLAFELTDVLNNPNGSFFRLVHLGAETHWKSFAFRAGINQGYLAAGFGIDFHYLTLDIATYGEELGLNTGTFEDRRYALTFGLHI